MWCTKLNSVPLKIRVHPEPENVTLLGIRFYEDVITVRFKIKSPWIRVGTKPKDFSLKEPEKEKTW